MLEIGRSQGTPAFRAQLSLALACLLSATLAGTATGLRASWPGPPPNGELPLHLWVDGHVRSVAFMLYFGQDPEPVLELVSPTGRIIKQRSTPGAPEVTYHKEPLVGTKYLLVTKPETGEWKVLINGNNRLPKGSYDVSYSLDVEDQLILEARLQYFPDAGLNFVFTASLDQPAIQVSNVDLYCYYYATDRTDVKGQLIFKAAGTGDNRRPPGRDFTSVPWRPSRLGKYQIVAVMKGLMEGHPFLRQGQQEIDYRKDLSSLPRLSPGKTYSLQKQSERGLALLFNFQVLTISGGRVLVESFGGLLGREPVYENLDLEFVSMHGMIIEPVTIKVPPVAGAMSASKPEARRQGPTAPPVKATAPPVCAPASSIDATASLPSATVLAVDLERSILTVEDGPNNVLVWTVRKPASELLKCLKIGQSLPLDRRLSSGTWLTYVSACGGTESHQCKCDARYNKYASIGGDMGQGCFGEVSCNYKKCSASASASEKGLTWRQISKNPATGTILVGCGLECDSHNGDTACTEALPLLCIKRAGAGFPLPVPAGVSRHLWSGGVVGTTRATVPPKTLAGATALCAKEFGAAWRVAEFHDGWQWSDTYGSVGDPSKRFWVHMKDRPGATCWR
jgi:hypothetical protein